MKPQAGWWEKETAARTGLSSLGIVDILGCIILSWGVGGGEGLPGALKVSTLSMPVAAPDSHPQLWKPKVSPDLSKYLWGAKSLPGESHCLERQAHTPVPVERFLEHSKTWALE